MPVLGALVGSESLFWLVLPFYFNLLPVLGIVAIVLAAIRQFWGLEWKLLVLLFFTATYFVLFFMMGEDPTPVYLVFVLIVPYSVVALAFSIWHFLFEKESDWHR